MQKTLILLFVCLGFFSCNQSGELKKEKQGTDGILNNSRNSTHLSDSNKVDTSFNLIKIKFTPFVPEYQEIGEDGRKILSDRLNYAISKIGYGGEGANP